MLHSLKTLQKTKTHRIQNFRKPNQELLEFVKENHPKAIIDFYEKKEKVQELQNLGESKAETRLRFFSLKLGI
ncbi:hypothetical protein AKJ62_01850 [candidate division MSBL1 archaeon SCGC-AAA259D14]|uniref:Uncharacterized protein n=3 Tax=candidate division MSBL1 TaxID=215777 RepID=A0A133UUA6_9EURY|nr:hypothetical protein AKJ62_01850 [candidate division MSBL1 archaeon SCGC-AAA259D14]KXA97710.1 hypothetical protein AKJ38_00410 [candidate division MSBL1 archaeon SCGC-AAA259I14]KXA98931.1 hypothetical protein AKJ39_00035 [candidate division MSBL1 archaeon SCGC-AAA259J03]